MGKWNKYIKVFCKDCGIIFSIRDDVIKHWQGRCLKCKNKEVANRPEVKSKKSKDAQLQVFRQGGILNAKKFDGSQKNEKHWNWQGGISREPYTKNWTETLREAIRQRDNYKCQKCECPQEECKKALCVHHIDKNKKNLNHNNLISLCRSCHMKIHNVKDGTSWYETSRSVN